MARNVVQFQKGLSEPAFEQQYGTDRRLLERLILRVHIIGMKGTQTDLW